MAIRRDGQSAEGPVIVDTVTKRYGKTAAVDAISLSVAPGAFVALLGPSGCGKTTLLRLLAGFEQLDDGRIQRGDTLLSAPDFHLPAERRRIGMVFQSYALWPHLSVAENIAYPLRVAKMDRRAIADQVGRVLAQTGLNDFGERRPADLSGGQRQRVALARCLAMKASLVLLDEPLANLDVHLRDAMQAEFRAFHRTSGAAMVYVTHDQAEAMALADTIVVMNKGRIEQIADPWTLYHEPATEMAAGFVGAGIVVDGTVLRADSAEVRSVAVLGAVIKARSPASAPNVGPVRLCLRPERMRLGAPREEADTVRARVTTTVFRGPYTSVEAAPEADPVKGLTITARGKPPAIGEAVGIVVEDAWVLPVASR